jgi:hypothetical protein
MCTKQATRPILTRGLPNGDSILVVKFVQSQDSPIAIRSSFFGQQQDGRLSIYCSQNYLKICPPNPATVLDLRGLLHGKRLKTTTKDSVLTWHVRPYDSICEKTRLHLQYYPLWNDARPEYAPSAEHPPFDQQFSKEG